MKKAYMAAATKAKARKIKSTEEEEEEEGWRRKVGSASAMVMNGEKLVVANMGEYRAVVCKDGVAHQIGRKRRNAGQLSWTRKLISGNVYFSKIYYF